LLTYKETSEVLIGKKEKEGRQNPKP